MTERKANRRLLVGITSVAILLVCIAMLMIAMNGNALKLWGFVEYQPVVANDNIDDLYVVDKSINTPEHQQALVLILQRYGESYLLQDGRVYISSRLSQEQDLLMNYTEKAELVRTGGGSHLLK